MLFLFALELVTSDVVEISLERLGPSPSQVCKVTLVRGLLMAAMLTSCFCSAMFHFLRMLEWSCYCRAQSACVGFFVEPFNRTIL